MDGARLGRGIDDGYAPSKDSPAVRVDTAWSFLSALNVSLKRLLELQECSDNAFRSRPLFSLLPWESETRNEKAGRDATITATSVLQRSVQPRDLWEGVLRLDQAEDSNGKGDQGEGEYGGDGKLLAYGHVQPPEKRENTMTDAEDGQRSKLGTGFSLTEEIGKDVERKSYGQELVV